MAKSFPSPTRLTGPKLWLAWAAWAAVAFLVAAVLSVLLPLNFRMTHGEWFVTQVRPALEGWLNYADFVRYLTFLESIVAFLCITMSLVVLRYKPDDGMGLFVSATLLLLSLLAISSNIDTWRFPPWLAPLQPYRNLLAALNMSSLLFFFYLFPDGRFRPSWTRWTAIPGLLVIALFTLPSILLPQSQDFSGDWGWLLFSNVFFGSLAVAVAAQVYRYRTTSNPIQRQQMKWVVFGLAFWLSSLLWQLLASLLLPQGWGFFIGSQLELLAMALVPISLGFSILRYRLWQVDILINRALVYGGLTLLVLSLYALVVGGASALFQNQTGAGASLLALVLVAFSLPPLHQYLRRGADRLIPVAAFQEALSPLQKTEIALSRQALMAIRAAWAAVTLLAIGLFAAGIQLTQEVDLVSQMPQLATQIDIALLRVFANNTFLSSTPVMLAAYGQFAAFLLVGLLLFWRKPADWLAILASTMLISTGAGFSPGLLFLPVLRPAWHLPVTLLQVILFTSLVIFLYLFPNGRFVPRWSRYLALAWLIYCGSWFFFPQLNPHRAASPLGLLTLILFTWLGLGMQVYRYRRVSTATERQQAKWVITGFLITQFGFSLLVLPALVGLSTPLASLAPVPFNVLNTLLGLSAVFIPITIAFAILRYRLWDIDLILHRALVYGGLTALVFALYFVVVGLFSALFRSGDNLLASVLVTGLIALLFNPLRQRLQRMVNRLMYGERDDPVTVLSRLGEQLEHTAAPAETLPVLVETVAQALKLPYVAVALHDEQTFPIVAASGSSQAGEAQVFPLVYQAELVGQLLVAPRAINESFSPAEHRLLQTIARQASSAVHATQLTHRLQRSRERLVTAREEERRRLHRDLHDGLGPQLATLTLKVDAARNHLASNPQASEQLLVELKAQIQDAIQDIRRLVYDLRPPALDQLGLVSALQAHIASQNGHAGLQINLEAPAEPLELPAAVEVAAYRIIQEALNNVVRHAQASCCTVRLSLESRLHLEVRDNGRGLPPLYDAGVGLDSMRERAGELGGDFLIENLVDGGTVVRAHLPLSPLEPQYE